MRILATVLRSWEQANVGNQINDEPPHTMKKGQITHRVHVWPGLVIIMLEVTVSGLRVNPSESHGCQIWAVWKTWLKYCNLSTIKYAPHLPPNNSQRKYRFAIFSLFIIKVFLVWQCDSLMTLNYVSMTVTHVFLSFGYIFGGLGGGWAWGNTFNTFPIVYIVWLCQHVHTVIFIFYFSVLFLSTYIISICIKDAFQTHTHNVSVRIQSGRQNLLMLFDTDKF